MTSTDPTAGTVLGEEARRTLYDVLASARSTVDAEPIVPVDQDKLRDLFRKVEPVVAALLSAAREAGREEGRREAAKAMRDPVRRMTAALIAVDSRLTEPYPDDPRWTPWTRFIEPALRELRAAADA